MHAAVVEAFGKPLVLRERAIPRAGAREIVFNRKACDACHTDLDAASGDWPLKPQLPFIQVMRQSPPSLIAFKQGVGMTRKRGACVLARLPPEDLRVPLFNVVANCITIRGSFLDDREDMAEALDFAARGEGEGDVELRPLSDINNVFTRLEHGDVLARVVI